MWVASIVHLTDMHMYLAVDEGVLRPVDHEAHVDFLLRQAYRTDSVRWRTLFVGLSEHNPRALRLLATKLPEVVTAERQEAIRIHGPAFGAKLPIVVVQTGDVDAYGACKLPDGTYRFPGWDHLQNAIAPLLAKADEQNAQGWIDVFGNHDVWGGAYPLTNPRAHRTVIKNEIKRIPGLEGPWPQRYPRRFSLPAGRSLEVYRASSVPEGWLSGVRARGKLTPHPLGQLLPLTNGDDALRELVAVAEASHDPRAVRLLLLHHPVHAFEAGFFKRNLTTASFADRANVARVVGRVPFHLVIAGHRHALDPSEGATRDARRPGQPPLPRGVGQLVAESPTQDPVVFDDVEPADPIANSFSLYRLLVDEERDALDVDRVVFRYLDAAEQPFRASEPESVITNLGLE